jgi:hypothetical protein
MPNQTMLAKRDLRLSFEDNLIKEKVTSLFQQTRMFDQIYEKKQHHQ